MKEAVLPCTVFLAGEALEFKDGGGGGGGGGTNGMAPV